MEGNVDVRPAVYLSLSCVEAGLDPRTIEALEGVVASSRAEVEVELCPGAGRAGAGARAGVKAFGRATAGKVAGVEPEAEVDPAPPGGTGN